MTSITTDHHAPARDSQMKLWIGILATLGVLLLAFHLGSFDAAGAGFMTDPNIAA